MEILAAAGFSEAELEHLVSNGVVKAGPKPSYAQLKVIGQCERKVGSRACFGRSVQWLHDIDGATRDHGQYQRRTP